MPRYRPRPKIREFSSYIPEPPNGVNIDDYLDNIISLILTPRKKTKKIVNRRYPILDFSACCIFAKSLNLKGERKWQEYSKSGRRPINCPSNPQRSYIDEWISWKDFLGY